MPRAVGPGDSARWLVLPPRFHRRLLRSVPLFVYTLFIMGVLVLLLAGHAAHTALLQLSA
jgi:hypothetical protein